MSDELTKALADLLKAKKAHGGKGANEQTREALHKAKNRVRELREAQRTEEEN